MIVMMPPFHFFGIYFPSTLISRCQATVTDHERPTVGAHDWKRAPPITATRE